MGCVPTPGILPPFPPNEIRRGYAEKAVAEFLDSPEFEAMRDRRVIVLQGPRKDSASTGPGPIIRPAPVPRCKYCGTQGAQAKCESCGAPR